jgi:hypothetical protein
MSADEVPTDCVGEPFVGVVASRQGASGDVGDETVDGDRSIGTTEIAERVAPPSMGEEIQRRIDASSPGDTGRVRVILSTGSARMSDGGVPVSVRLGRRVVFLAGRVPLSR